MISLVMATVSAMVSEQFIEIIGVHIKFPMKGMPNQYGPSHNIIPHLGPHTLVCVFLVLMDLTWYISEQSYIKRILKSFQYEFI